MRLNRRTSTTSIGGVWRAWGRAADGGVAVTVAVMIAVLVGILAMAIDLGRAYNLSTELNNAADAYALAGATQLDQSPGSCVRAIQAAVASSTAGSDTSALVNTETFASNPSGSDVYVDPTLSHVGNSNIRFLRDLAKDASGNLIHYVTDPDPVVCDDTAEYIEVTIDQASQNDPYRVDFSFAGVVGAVTEVFPKGHAVAGLGQLFCGIAPIFMCELESGFWTNLKTNPTYYRGVGVWTKANKPSETWSAGNTGFLDLGGWGGGVGSPVGDGLCNALGSVNPKQSCYGTKDLVTKTGNSTGARLCFNTRFDIYQGSLDAYRTAPQYQPAANTVKGRFKAGCNDTGWEQPGTQYNGPGSIDVNDVPEDAGMPLPLDNCAYGGGCMPAGSEGRMGDGVWDLETYLAVNHPDMDPDLAKNEIMMTATGTIVGGFGRADHITRFDVYRWELGYSDMSTYGAGNYGHIDEDYANLVNNVPVPETPLPMPLGDGPTPPNPQVGEYGGPQCYTGDMGDDGATNTVVTKDRRVIRIAVVDCTGLGPGKNTVDALGYLDMFLLAPWKDDGTNHEIYMEIIGPAADQNYDKTAAKQIVQLYE